MSTLGLCSEEDSGPWRHVVLW